MVAQMGGFEMQLIADGYLAYDITRSPFLTSVAMGLDALPFLLAGPLGGLVADAFNKRRLFILGLIAASTALPVLVFCLFGGAIADRMDRKQLIQMGQGAAVLLALFVALSITTDTVT